MNKALLVVPLVLGVLVAPMSASADSWWKLNLLPPGIQKKVDNGGETPLGIWKRLFSRSQITIRSIDEDVATSSAVITFDTKASTTAKVYFGKTKNLNTSSASAVDATMRTEHEIALGGLDSDTVYYYKIVVKDSQNRVRESAVMKFMTNRLDDESNNPEIEYMITTDVKENSATILWVTDEKTRGEVWVGTSTVSIDASPTLTLGGYGYSHSALVTGLSASTTYKYKVRSTDASGDAVVSSEASFVTR